MPTADGAFVVNEPQGSPGWYPANDNPQDKATFDIAVTVPEGKTAIANGRLIKQRTKNGMTTWHWYEDSPMAPYLATATNGVFDMTITEVDGIPLYQAVDPTLGNVPLAKERLAAEAEIITFFSDLYGKYPFSSGGGVADRGGVGYALESQTKPMYDTNSAPGGVDRRPRDRAPVVRQRGHAGGVAGHLAQRGLRPLLGVDLRGAPRRPDRRRCGSTRSTRGPATDGLWSPAPAAIPGPAQMFGSEPYDRGAMTLQALRVKIGDEDFFKLLRRWYKRNRYGNVTTAQFIAAAERVSGQQLDAFFDVWLYQPVKPTSW